MKKLLLSSALAVTLVLGAPLLTGCRTVNSPTAESVVVNSFDAAGTTAKAALTGWLYYAVSQERALLAQPASAERTAALARLQAQEARVELAYNTFRLAYLTALDAAQLDLTKPVPTDVLTLLTRVQQLVAELAK